MEGSSGRSDIERRAFKRLKVDFSIIYRINKPWHVRVLISGEEVEALAVDLSEGGIAITTDKDIPVSTILAIKIMIYTVTEGDAFQFYKNIEAEGEIRSNVLADTGKHRIGIIFTQISEEGKKELIRFAKINKEE